MAKIYFQVCPFCRGEAFRYKRRPYKGMAITTSVVDVQNVKKGELMKCSKCGEIIFNSHLTESNLGVINEPDSK